MTMDTSKVLRLPRKIQPIFWNPRNSIAPATQNDCRHVTKHVWMSRSATPATRNEATTSLKPTKSTPSAELPIGTAIRGSCGRVWTVATTNATSSEHTLNPQTPRVKREPLLRIREKNTETIRWKPQSDGQTHHGLGARMLSRAIELVPHRSRRGKDIICDWVLLSSSSPAANSPIPTLSEVPWTTCPLVWCLCLIHTRTHRGLQLSSCCGSSLPPAWPAKNNDIAKAIFC